MPQSLSSVHIHLVFSTKGRQPFLKNEEIRKEMHAYLGGVSKKLDCFPVIVSGTEDHVHLLCRLARTITQADWVKESNGFPASGSNNENPHWRRLHGREGMVRFRSVHQP
jgi:REP element-mobilizing transposase RayT